MSKIQITKLTPYLTSLASILFSVQFIYRTIQSTLEIKNLMLIGITLSIGFFIVLGLRNEFSLSKKISLKENPRLVQQIIRSTLVILGNTLVTFVLAFVFGASTTLAASLTSLVSTFLFKEYDSEAYSGAVAGMIGVYYCSHWSIPLIISIVTAVIFILFLPYFRGIGGRGGAIPYVATVLTVKYILKLNQEFRSPIEAELILPSLVLIILASFLVYSVNEKTTLNTTQAGMGLTFLAALLIPVQYSSLVTAIFSGSIIGMSVESRVKNYTHLLIISIVSFILYIPSFHILDGIGGKLGMLNFLAYQASIGLKIVSQYFKRKSNVQSVSK